MTSFVKYCLTYGSKITPLSCSKYKRPIVALCNPSVCVVGDKVITNLRGVNYHLWHSDQETFNSVYGPTCYITENNDNHLRTENFIGELYGEHTQINSTSPKRWEFVGLEDIRLVYWEGKLYATGVRRDYWYNGEGRMVLAEVDMEGGYKDEVVLQIEDAGFCEKNWMPITDKPYHYVRFVNPTQIVKADPTTGVCEVVSNKELPNIPYINFDGRQMRGSSQVVRVKDFYIAIIHTVHLELNEKGEKSATDYSEQFIVWDKDFNFKYISKPFHFADFTIEFTTGLAYKDGIFYIPFALQDNASFCLEVTEEVLTKYLEGGDCKEGWNPQNMFERFFDNTKKSNNCLEMAMYYMDTKEYASACVMLGRAVDCSDITKTDKYNALFWYGRCLVCTNECDEHEESLYLRMIDLCPEYSDGYYMIALYYHWRKNYRLAYTMCKIACDKDTWVNIPSVDNKILLLKCLYHTEDYNLVSQLLRTTLNECTTKGQKEDIYEFLNYIDENKKNITRIL